MAGSDEQRLQIFAPVGAAVVAGVAGAGVGRGWEGAAAGALNIALAGPRRYQKRVTDDPWLGDGTARTSIKDIQKMLYLYVTAALINVAWVAALAIIRLN